MPTDTERLDWLASRYSSYHFHREWMDPDNKVPGWEVTTSIGCAQVAFERTFREAIDTVMERER